MSDEKVIPVTETFQQHYDVEKTTIAMMKDGTHRRFHHLKDGRIIEAVRVTEYRTEYREMKTNKKIATTTEV